MGKRIGILCLWMYLFICVGAITAQAAPFAQGICGTSATWSLDLATGRLTISGSGQMYNYLDGKSMPGYCEKEYASRVKSIVVQGSVSYIGDGAFCDLPNVTSVSLSNYVTEIADFAFDCCTNLKSFVCPDSLTTLGYGVFGATNIETFTFGRGLRYLDPAWAQSMHKLKYINVPSDNPYFTAIDNVLYNKDKSRLLKYPEGKAGNSYMIPEGVMVIGKDAFESTRPTTIYFPSTLKTIENNAFGMSNLNRAELSINLTSIGDYAFWNCSNLQEIILTAGIQRINPYVFSGCKNLTQIMIPESVTDIGEGAFSGCVNLKEVFFVGNPPSIIGVNGQGNRTASFEKRVMLYYDSTRAAWGAPNKWNGYSACPYLFGADFIMGRDSFSFNHTISEWGNKYYMMDEHMQILKSIVGYWEGERLQKIWNNQYLDEEFWGNCFGVSAILALIENERLSINAISKESNIKADTPFELIKPSQNKYLRSFFSYYQLLQETSSMNNYKSNVVVSLFKQRQYGEKIVNALTKRTEPVIVLMNDGLDAHAVLAYKIDMVSNRKDFIIHCADINAMMASGKPVRSEMHIDRNTFKLSSYYSANTRTGVISFRENWDKIYGVVDDLSVFEEYNLQKATGTIQQTEGPQYNYSSYATVSLNYSISAGSKKAVIENGVVVSGDLDVTDSRISAGGEGGLRTYEVETADEYIFTFPDDAESRVTFIRMGGSTPMFSSVDTDSQVVRFGTDGVVKIQKATVKTSASTVVRTPSGKLCGVEVETEASDIVLTPDEWGCMISSTQKLGNISIKGSDGINSLDLLDTYVDSQTAYVSVTYDENGQVDVFLIDSKEQSLPDTGDNSHIVTWLLLFSFCGLLTRLCWRREYL